MKPRIKSVDRRRAVAETAAAIRGCCDTNVRAPHAETCKRAPFRCGTKTPFATRAKAIAACERRSANGRMTPYRCPSCNLWHIGHPKTTAEGL